jgi:hypothetical protein
MERNLAYLLPENLYRVFNETDLDKRKAAIADLWEDERRKVTYTLRLHRLKLYVFID